MMPGCHLVADDAGYEVESRAPRAAGPFIPAPDGSLASRFALAAAFG